MRCQRVGAKRVPIGWKLSSATMLFKPVVLSYQRTLLVWQKARHRMRRRRH